MESTSYAGYPYSIRRRARSDGVFYWYWEVRGPKNNWTLKTGNAFGSRDIALDQVRRAIREHQKDAQEHSAPS
jgi:hypothetical protein